MTRQLAVAVAGLFVFVLFAGDRKRGRPFNWQLAIPLLWVLIVGSKAPSSWFLSNIEDNPDGSPLDRLVFFGLIIAGLLVLKQRRVSWHSAFTQNKCLFVYFLYIGVSVLWTSSPFASLKLWVKNLGNIVMVLVVLSEANPLQAVRSVLLKACYVFSTGSVLLVKYFPEVGRVYDTWTFRPKYIGVSTSKNELGAALFVAGVGLLWSLFELWRQKPRSKRDLLSHLVILAFTSWLLVKSHSATAIACLVLAVLILLAMQQQRLRLLVQRLGLSSFILIPLSLVGMHYLFNLGEALVWTLGRDLTFTGRTSIWDWCLRAEINPLLGAGYCDFWRGPRAKIISQGIGFYYVLKEAHNGYLETYLNCGLLGLTLLLGGIATGAARIWARLYPSGTLEPLRFTLLVTGLLYNLSESAFDGLNIVWFGVLLSIMQYNIPQTSEVNSATTDQNVRSEPPTSKPDFAAA